ncbi:MAG: cytochrome c biogenesis protein CcsA [Planctomycetia bacterium]|nr:cytochrome c biogenesis protein CcsA [Planctomycetia bacterium]
MTRPPALRRPATVAALVLVLVAGLASPLLAGRAAADGPAAPAPSGAGAGPWSDEVLDLAARLPVQDGGRVKPLDTFATYTLLGIAHKRSAKDAAGEKLTPTAWLLDVVFRPSVAETHPCFLVENDEVLDAVGLAHEGKKKRDLYSYAALRPAAAKLRELALVYMKKDAKGLTPVQHGVVDLYRGTTTFERLSHLVDFGRAELDVSASPALKAVFDGKERVRVADVLARAPSLSRVLPRGDPHGGGAGPVASDPGVASLLARLRELAEASNAVAMIPPPGPVSEQETWFTPGEALQAVTEGITLPPEIQALMLGLAGMGGSVGDRAAFVAHLRDVAATAERMTRTRGEYEKIPLEVSLNRLDPFHRGAGLYILAFLLVAAGWLVRNRWVRGAAWTVLLAALVLQVAGIWMRCILRERPPISTLYETVLFISALGVAACAVAELFDRRGIALTLAPVLGALGLMLANSYESLKGEDTMPQLVAVLDTNYWLTLHVTCIAIGYTGGLVAAALAHVTVLGRTFGLRAGDEAFYRSAGKMTYGMLAFGLLFSVVGTILGGIWANDSWGRFWGWDPKENGALMICLAQLAILHGRLGGYLKTFGIAMATIAQGTIVAFSWWHVNHLGIGLHAYGFTQGVITTLTIFYVVEALVLAAGFSYLFRRGSGASASTTS